MTMQGWTDAQEKLKRVTQIVPIIAIESVWAIVDGELSTESEIKPVAVRQIADVTDRITTDWKYVRFIRQLKDKFMSGFLHALPAEINGIRSALII